MRSLRMEAARRQARGQPRVRWQRPSAAGGQGPWSLGHWPLVSEFRRPHCYHVNVPGETRIRAVAQGNAAPDRAEMQNEIVELLRDVVRGFRALLQPLGDGELDVIARGLAALQRAFQRPQEQGMADRPGSPPC